MKNIIGAFIMAVLAVCIALPNLVFAGAEGSTASGSFKFSLDDGETRFVEFKASELAEGTGEGEMPLVDGIEGAAEDREFQGARQVREDAPPRRCGGAGTMRSRW